jgi:isocitrate dehydrogenase
MSKSKIYYTLTDEAPLLATAAFLPVVRTFVGAADIDVEEADISVAGRILAAFPECLTEAQRMPNTLAELGKPDAQAPCQHHQAAQYQRIGGSIGGVYRELQGKGYAIPDFPENPQTEEDKAIRARYAKCIGSSVNPVLREGNSDRRAPRPSRNSPARTRTAWPSGAKRHAATCRTCMQATSITAKSP